MSVKVHVKQKTGSSARDRFGWLSIEGADIPYITREAKGKFVPVKAVEMDILSCFPSVYPKEIAERPPLVCQYMKPEEVSILNNSCKQQGVTERFTDIDPVVRLSDFLDFFTIVKQAYPNVVIRKGSPTVCANDHDDGWVLISDAMVPYVTRRRSRFVPLNVIRGAAQLLVGVTVKDIRATDIEVTRLNDMCRNVGLVFTFQKNTLMVDLTLIVQTYPERTIHDLPKENPMEMINSVQLAGDGTDAQIKQTETHHPISPTSKADDCTGGHEATSQPSAGTLPEALINIDEEGQGQNQTISSKSVHHNESNHMAHSTNNNGLGVEEESPNRDVEPIKRESSSSNQSYINSLDTQISTVSPSVKHLPSVIKSTKQTSPIVIEPMECFGRMVSCLLRGKTNVAYALVEAVCRVYFPSCSLVDFIHFLELDLAITLYVLRRCEEEAFIEFYGIPTKHLRCNQLIKLQDLKDRMGWLQRRFGLVDEPDSGDEEVMNDDDEDLDTAWQMNFESDPADNECLSRTTNKESRSPVRIANGRSAVVMDRRFQILRSDSEVKENTPNSIEQIGKNKNLENTIMRILHEKRGIIGQHLSTESKTNIDQNLDCRDASRTTPHPRVHSVNKRKGAPPRKYLAMNHEKDYEDC